MYTSFSLVSRFNFCGGTHCVPFPTLIITVCCFVNHASAVKAPQSLSIFLKWASPIHCPIARVKISQALIPLAFDHQLWMTWIYEALPTATASGNYVYIIVLKEIEGLSVAKRSLSSSSQFCRLFANIFCERRGSFARLVHSRYWTAGPWITNYGIIEDWNFYPRTQRAVAREVKSGLLLLVASQVLPETPYRSL